LRQKVKKEEALVEKENTEEDSKELIGEGLSKILNSLNSLLN